MLAALYFASLLALLAQSKIQHQVIAMSEHQSKHFKYYTQLKTFL